MIKFLKIPATEAATLRSYLDEDKSNEALANNCFILYPEAIIVSVEEAPNGDLIIGHEGPVVEDFDFYYVS